MQKEDIIKELGLENLSKEEQDKFIAEISENLQLRIGMKFGDMLNAQQMKEFEEVMDTGNEEATTKWLEANIPNYTQLVIDELELIKSEMKSSVDETMQSLNS